jgi:hypothetical protein
MRRAFQRPLVRDGIGGSCLLEMFSGFADHGEELRIMNERTSS